MSTCEWNKSYIKLLKKESLTISEINNFNTEYTIINVEYPYL